MALAGSGAELGVSPELAGMAAGWLLHSRIVESREEDDGRIMIRIQGPFA